jgi:hypothetical protein
MKRLAPVLTIGSLLLAVGLGAPHAVSAHGGSRTATPTPTATPKNTPTPTVTPKATATPAPSPTSTSGPGGGGTPPISFSPTSLNFGSQANGTTSAAQTVTATNTGTANLFFNNVAESGSFGLDYTIVNDGCVGLTLAPGQSCQTSVTFSPNNTGGHAREPRLHRQRREQPADGANDRDWHGHPNTAVDRRPILRLRRRRV